MRKIPYVYARSLEFEGRHPHDVGQWGVTNMRLLYLEGLPQFLEENMVPINDDGTFQSTPTHLHTYFWPQRVRYYRRIRSANEAASAMKLREPDALTKVCLPLYSSWVKPDKAIIEMPPPGEVPAPETHAVHLKEFFRLGGSVVDGEKDAPYFLFQNTWGDEWGLNGMALLPFAYYNKYAFEQWAIYNLDQLTRVQVRKLSSDMTAWQGREEFDRRVYAFEVGNPDRERLGWAFATESKHGIELEELFVAPGARGQGIGARLADMVRQLAQAKSMPLAMWVPFADTQRESPATFPALPKIARRLGLEFVPSPVRWAAYFAVSDHKGSPHPLEPEFFPGRPKSTREALTAFFAGMALAVGSADSHPAAPSTEEQAIVTSHPSTTLESPEWAAKNARRAALSRKKNRVGLDDIEKAEFEYLQATARALVAAASPPPKLFVPEIEALLAAKAKP